MKTQLRAAGIVARMQAHNSAPRTAVLRPPGLLTEVFRPAGGPVPWLGMSFAALAVGLPLTLGLSTGHTVPGVLAAIGGVVGTMADRAGPGAVRMQRVAVAGAVGAGGLLLGTAVHGRGWVTVAAMVAAAGASAVLSSFGAMWSTAGMFLLVYASLALGPLGALAPWWQPPLWFLAGIGWTLVLLLPGLAFRPRGAEQRRVAAVYSTLAGSLRNPGDDAARRSLVAALNVAWEDLVGQRAASSGRDRRLARLLTLLGQARLAAETAGALTAAGERPPDAAAVQAEALADAVMGGTPVQPIAPPPAAGPALRALYGSLAVAADIAAGRPLGPGTWSGVELPVRTRRSLSATTASFRETLASTFALRLMLCIGIATVFSEVLPLQRSYWVPLAVAVVMKPDFGSVFARALQYGAGTVVGALIAAPIVAAHPSDLAMLAPVAVFAALLPYAMSRNYALFAVFFTPLVVVLIELLSPGGWQLAEARLVDIGLGCGVVLVFGYALWPSSWHANVPRDFADALDDTADYLAQALRDPAPGAAATVHARARKRYAALQVELQRVRAEPRRVHERVTAWWPAVVALGHLLEAVTSTAVATAGSPADASAVDELGASLRRLAAAVRSGAPVRPETFGIGVPQLELVCDAARSLQDALADAPPEVRRLRAPRFPLPGSRHSREPEHALDTRRDAGCEPLRHRPPLQSANLERR